MTFSRGTVAFASWVISCRFAKWIVGGLESDISLTHVVRPHHHPPSPPMWRSSHPKPLFDGDYQIRMPRLMVSPNFLVLLPVRPTGRFLPSSGFHWGGSTRLFIARPTV